MELWKQEKTLLSTSAFVNSSQTFRKSGDGNHLFHHQPLYCAVNAGRSLNINHFTVSAELPPPQHCCIMKTCACDRHSSLSTGKKKVSKLSAQVASRVPLISLSFAVMCFRLSCLDHSVMSLECVLLKP